MGSKAFFTFINTKKESFAHGGRAKNATFDWLTLLCPVNLFPISCYTRISIF